MSTIFCSSLPRIHRKLTPNSPKTSPLLLQKENHLSQISIFGLKMLFPCYLTLGPSGALFPVSKCKKWWKDGLCRLFQGTKRDWAVQASTGLLVSNSLANRGRSVKVCVWCSWRFQKKRAEVFWFLCWAIFHRPDVWVWVPLSNHVDSVLEWMFLRGNIPNMSILYWTTLDYAAKPRPNKNIHKR